MRVEAVLFGGLFLIHGVRQLREGERMRAEGPEDWAIAHTTTTTTKPYFSSEDGIITFRD